MPTYTMRRGKRRWRGVVKQNGKIVVTKWFADGKKEHRNAVVWEEKTKKKLQEETRETIPTDSLSLLNWANEYLSYSQRMYVEKTYNEKKAVLKSFLQFAAEAGREIEDISTGFAKKFLELQFDSRSGNAANKDRKNLAAAWKMGRKYLDGFPGDRMNPFRAVEKFPEQRKPRYVPPIEDLDAVLAVSKGQDHVMLTAFLHLAARRGELFRLTWQDIDFNNNRVSLSTRKTRDGSVSKAWVPMSSELRRELLWWRENRPYKSAKHVFVMLQESCSPRHNPGGPFTSRQHFMKKICRKAKVPAFGFHAIRHMAAGYLYHIGKPLSLIQRILRHEAPSTTERYLKSLGIGMTEMRAAVEAFSERGSAQAVKRTEEKSSRSSHSESLEKISTRDIQPHNVRR